MYTMPEKMSLGFESSVTYSTDKLTLRGGGERRKKNREDMVHVYQFSYENRLADEVAMLRQFYVGMRGDFTPFLLKDWADFSVAGVVLGTGDGSAVDFQLVQIFSAYGDPYTRTIRHPKTGTVVLYDNAVVVDEGDYSVDVDTGIVTFDTAPTDMHEITADFEFYVPVRFDGDTFTEKLPNRILNARNVVDLSMTEVLGL